MTDYGLTQEEIEIIKDMMIPYSNNSPTFTTFKLPKRAERRLQRERKVEKAKRVLRTMWGEEKVKHASLWADNLQKCSCHMCCNPRRNAFVKGKDKLTLAELKAIDSANDQLKEVHNDDQN